MFDTFNAARTAIVDQNDSIYTYETRYDTYRNLARLYRCRSHERCEHRFKIKELRYQGVPTTYQLEESGQHGATGISVQRRGIHPLLVEEIDSLLRMGWGAQQLRSTLLHRFRHQPERLRLIPTRKQLENRKALLVKSANGWEILNHASFTAWAIDLVCMSREQFMSVTDPRDYSMDEIIVLDTFTVSGEEDEGTSFGVIVSSRPVFRNIANSVRDQGNELVCASDGTFKLHFGGWTVVDCRSTAVTWSRGTAVHRLIPWVYMIVRSESTATHTRMFQIVREKSMAFLDIEVNVASGSLDHSDVIASAFQST
ncbi:hypothetical protein F443_00568 [Phytophthora nicotianae P1569]|uniref:Uncharacterized protein n=1 Tax=Phytophthora nicotianae P1569 TaxID=1317065 RepID=V9G163_PHYNI|nr:hypothetical protein F443_00568 [Phytophthora nicotianae P1569]